MERTSERVLRAIVYYCLIAVALALVGLFVARVATNETIDLWVQIVYYIWAAALAIVMIWDIVCVNMRNTKCYLGYCLLGITVAAVVMADVLFMNLNVINALGTTVEVTFMGLMSLCFMPTILAIVAYFVGRRIMLGDE